MSLLIAEATAEAEVVFHYSPNSSDTMELFFYLPITLPAAVILFVIATTISSTSILGLTCLFQFLFLLPPPLPVELNFFFFASSPQ